MTETLTSDQLAAAADDTKIEIIPINAYSATQGTTKVDISSSNIERIVVKALNVRARPRSTNKYASGPKVKGYDYLNILETFHVTGTIKGSDWDAVQTTENNIMTILNGGGTFCLNTRGTYYEVNATNTAFIRDRVEHVIEYDMTLINCEGPK